jgi:hypothetical protein
VDLSLLYHSTLNRLQIASDKPTTSSRGFAVDLLKEGVLIYDQKVGVELGNVLSFY